jgi:hypothetical protein
MSSAAWLDDALIDNVGYQLGWAVGDLIDAESEGLMRLADEEWFSRRWPVSHQTFADRLQWVTNMALVDEGYLDLPVEVQLLWGATGRPFETR